MRHDRNGTLLRLFGLWLGLNTWGNCFRPAVTLHLHLANKAHHHQLTGRWLYPAKAILTFRNLTETRIYWRGWFRFDWQSQYIARRWGVAVEAPHGTCWHYTGWMGTHWDI